MIFLPILFLLPFVPSGFSTGAAVSTVSRRVSALGRQSLKAYSPGVRKRFFAEARDRVPSGFLNQLYTGADEVRPALRKFVGRGNKTANTLQQAFGEKSPQLAERKNGNQILGRKQEMLDLLMQSPILMRESERQTDIGGGIGPKRPEYGGDEAKEERKAVGGRKPTYSEFYDTNDEFYLRDLYDEMYAESN